jgi:hypothetical protein
MPITEIGQDLVGRCYAAVLYQAGCLTDLPWGDAQFDCVVFACDSARAFVVGPVLATELARANVDWIQVAGCGSEELHDQIDRASVSVGRQQAIGDGSPMTSWHKNALAPEQMADVAFHCFGGCEWVLVLVVGQRSDLLASIAAVKRRLKCHYLNRGADD